MRLRRGRVLDWDNGVGWIWGSGVLDFLDGKKEDERTEEGGGG